MKNLEFDDRLSYFIGARYKKGPYKIVNKDTGEVKSEGITDKWRLCFVTPFDKQETNFVDSFGSSSTYFDVNADELCFLFGKSEKEFKIDFLNSLVGQPVFLDIAVTNRAEGTTAKLRGIMTYADLQMKFGIFDKPDKSSK